MIGMISNRAMRRASTAVAALVVAAASLPAQAQVVGINSAVRNQVTVRAGGIAPPRPAVVKAKVSLRDAVQTAAASQLQLMLLDGSVFTVGPNARLTIDRFVYDPTRNVKSVGASVARGAFRFMSGRAASSGSTIRTPIATIGIRGTLVEGVVGSTAVGIASREAGVGPNVGGDASTASLIVLRGPGPNTQGSSRPGAIDVDAGGRTASANRPMMAIYVPRAGAAPIGPFMISPMGLAALNDSIFPASLAAGAAVAVGTARTGGAGQTSGGVRPETAGSSLSLGGAGIPGLAIAGGGLVALGIVVATTGGERRPSSN